MATKASILTARERAFAAAITQINRSNPFTSQRIAHEREALGDRFIDEQPEWNLDGPTPGFFANVLLLREEVEALVLRVNAAWPKGGGVDPAGRGGVRARGDPPAGRR